MTALGIRYLTGSAVATNIATPRKPEFPPHFGRVFMAMAATYFETRGNDDERKALEWLEAAGAPSISASGGHARSFVETYVPVNDKHNGIIGRSKQPRSFPTMRPDSPFVFLIWASNVPHSLRDALERLCGKVTRIGHSSSLVQMWLADEGEQIEPEWQPGSGLFDEQMRIAERGTLAYLERVFNANAIEEYGRLADAVGTAKGKKQSELKRQIAERFPEGAPQSDRPVLTRWQGYARAAIPKSQEKTWRGPFDPELIILTRGDEQRVLGLESTLQLMSALRDATMKAVGSNVPEWLSGHQVDGRPTLKPHAAFFPLPFVGAKFADGHVMGLAMAVPRVLDLHNESRQASLQRVLGPLLFQETGQERIVTLWRRSKNNPEELVWKWELEREKREYPPVTLRARTWVGPSYEWASVTPVVLHHYPKRARENDVERILLESFESAGLPAPIQIRAQSVSIFEGVGLAKSMPEFAEGGEKLCRYQVHVVVKFPVPVEGPVLVGRGRFRGYGLLRPMEVKRG
jgi:CRISPR-associated protein Csb2